jgi:hypothetical protein
MAKYLTNKETQAALERIIYEAQKKLVLISPYIRLTNALYSRIKGAGDRGVSIKIIHRVNEVKPEQLENLRIIKGAEIRCTADLHAKCYFNEKEMLVTSLNLLGSSEENWEMGIQLHCETDKEMFDAARRDALDIFGTALTHEKQTPTPDKKKPAEEKNKKVPEHGYCIRCEKEIPFNIEKPYCHHCYDSWADYKNADYEEKFCHSCSKEENTTMEKPLCYKCYKKYEAVLA